jgi:4-carboxymuconolactone decarboxylase
MPYANKSSDLVPRYNGPSEQEMTEEQAEIRQSILASRPGTGLHGPFGPWLAIPSIARPAQQLGQACRYGTSLTKRESEIVILLTGAKYQSSTEFDIHVGEALKAGWTMDLIEAIPRTDFSLANVKTNVVPILLQDNTSSSSSRERAIAIFAAELLETNTVSDETYQSTKEALDEQDSVLVEITSIVGYYAHVCLTLNVFQIPSF